jgi:hypothetical protein
MKPITLKHGDEIRVESDRPSFRYMNKLEVGTIRGYAIECNACPDESVATAIKFGHSLNPWVGQDCSVLTADYKGKTEELAAVAAAKAASPLINENDVVEIEGHLYTAKFIGGNYSDPIHFVPVKPLVDPTYKLTPGGPAYKYE